MEAFQAVKDRFPRLSKTETIVPAEYVEIETEKLRQRLLEEGVNEVDIQESEHILRSELSEMHKLIVVLKHRQLLLMDTLRHLEAEKVDLENRRVRESPTQSSRQKEVPSDQQTNDKYSDQHSCYYLFSILKDHWRTWIRSRKS